jgi:hypothetical protein
MQDSFYEGIGKWVGQTAIADKYRKIRLNKHVPKYTAINNQGLDKQQKSIVFLCPATNTPIGGVKVIYNQAAMINSLNGSITANVLHPLNPNFSCSWFVHDAPIKRSLEFSRTSDFVLIPEFWAVPHARLFHELGVRYGIYVQNGYATTISNGDELDAAYSNAALIFAISNDAMECVKLGFSSCVEKIHRVHYSVDPRKFKAERVKENIICYMPRKLKDHSQLVTFFLNKRIPAHWRIEIIDGVDEGEVATILGKSKIFLSFSAFEGCPLPPVEAALSGCYVIGYTGEGAKEYWSNEMFTEIYSGDIRSFVSAVVNKISEIDSTHIAVNQAAIDTLASKYSAELEISDMKLMAEKILDVLN